VRLLTPWQYTFNAPGTATLQASLLPGDVNPSNDTKTTIVTVEAKGKNKGKDKDK